MTYRRPRRSAARARGARCSRRPRGASPATATATCRSKQVAREAGYTRGALYHQFKDKEDLALAVIDWVDENWMREVGEPARQEPDPVAELIALARGHAVFCRRDIARVVMALQGRVQRPGPSGRPGDRADLGNGGQARAPA